MLKEYEDKLNANKEKDDNMNVNVIGNRNKKQNKDIKKIVEDKIKKECHLVTDRMRNSVK